MAVDLGVEDSAVLVAGLLEVADHLALGRLIYRLYNKSVETVEELKQQIELLKNTTTNK